ncbi:XrtA/PEP-CTERM system TPR-repeat protein PrsT [Pelomonas sp. SE-A7]|uniref:XrtA/PEP-CTERM system TPR-repeat protein PrsT n=1 Tax=Pelomonas sp. SE-A7 TaxID=3054953 RepID=UPI00259CB521|nr:XrtA/PEP-CTERM system TPR-repeat protein PrsT [Pelomonas sp. SE-A7]MDM4765610.1 PEP-CTERM system TPR-repeat protein PrsT [Pelomonas sp. SE-A7]
MRRESPRRFATLYHAIPLIAALLAAHPAQAADTAKASKFYEDALRRYERKDMAGAVVQLKNALQVDRTILQVHVLLGKALLAQGDLAAAEVELVESLRLGVDRAEIAVNLATTLSAQGKQLQIFGDPRLAPEGLPVNVQLPLLLVRASAYADVGDTRNALRSIEQARAIDPRDASSWITEVPVRIKARQFTEAMVAADRALQLAPTNGDAHYQKGTVFHVMGQVRPALASYDQALKLDAGHIEARLSHAGVLMDLGRIADVEADLKELDSLAPDEPRASYLKALIAEQKGDKAAAKTFLKAITELLDPVPIEFLRYRTQAMLLNGMAHYGLNEVEKAKPFLEFAAKQQPNSPLIKLLAQIALREPNVPRAVELLEGYLKINSGDGQALLMLASAHLNQGRHSRATALMQEALNAKDAPQFRTALGLSLMQGGQSLNAITELEKAFKTDPNQVFAGLALVNLYMRSNQGPKALKVADALVKAKPNNASALIVQGMARLAARDFNGAKASYEQAAKLDPKMVEPRLGLARVDITSKAFDAAHKKLTALLKEYPRLVDALLEMAALEDARGKTDEVPKWLNSAVDAASQREVRPNFALVAWHLRSGDGASALQAAKQLLAKLPEDVEALQAYAAAQLATNDPLGARTTLTTASRRAGYEPVTLVSIADAQLRANDLPGAAYSLEKALGAQPDDLPAMSLMTVVELRQGDSTKAEKRARQIIASHPKLAIGHALLADTAVVRGQTQAAVEALRRAHELDKTTASFLRLFGLLVTQDDSKPAFALADGWIRAHPSDVVAIKAVADSQARAGNFAAARRGYESVVKQRPDDVEALNNLANVLMRQGDPGALALADRALALAPRQTSLIDTAGWANHLAGKRDRALQLLRDARLRDPNNPEIRYHLAAVLAQAGRKAEAKDEVEAALRLANASRQSFESANQAKELAATLK